MSIQKIASRYATSLLDLAREQEVTASVKEDIEGLIKVTDNRDFYLLLKSPIVPPSKKQAIVEEIFSGKVQPLTMEFFKIIIRKNRENLLPEIAEEFLNQYRALNNITAVRLTTATPLDDHALAALRDKLKETGVVPDKMEVTTVVDEKIIGGFIVEIGDKIIDNSVAHKLSSLSKTILN